jgi:RecA-family ATPase
MDRLRRVLKAAQATFGSDAAVTNTGRVMRLAGGIAWPVKDGRVLEQTQWRAYPDRPVYPIERLERAFGCADLSLVERVTQGPAVAPKVDDARGAISRALSVEVLLQRIRAGQEWHNNMIRLVAHQIGCGRSDAEILAMAAGLTLPGYTVEQTEREMRQAIEGGRRKWDKPNVEKQFDPETREILEEGAAPNAAQSIPLPVLNPANWQGQTLPVRRFLVPGLVPLGAVTLLSGDGGTGKSYLALQLATSAVCGEKWLNMPVKSGPALVLACEDDADELHLRLHDITSAIGHRFDELVGMRIVSGVGLDATIFEADEGVSKGRLTARYKEIEKEARDLRPVVIVLDTAADIFAANENSRRIVRQFIGALTGLAIEFKCAIILLAHPSKAGMANGDVYSGSTAWNTSVRSRLSLQYAEKRKSDDGEDSAVDRDGRVLKHPKTNRGARLDDMKLRWQGGVFVRTDAPAGPIDRMAADAEADRRFLDYLGRLTAQGGSVTEHKSPSYAPALMAKRFADDGARKPDLERAMHRLLNAQKIRIEKDGPPSKRRKRLVLVGGSE